MCYTIYLFHYVVVANLLPLTRSLSGGFAVQLLIFTAVVLLLSAAYYLAVERPCRARDWPQRLLAAGRRLESPPVPQRVGR
jgi:peptidoglycan/LPS O-acetylase OafA/YrhL